MAYRANNSRPLPYLNEELTRGSEYDSLKVCRATHPTIDQSPAICLMQTTTGFTSIDWHLAIKTFVRRISANATLDARDPGGTLIRLVTTL